MALERNESSPHDTTNRAKLSTAPPTREKSSSTPTTTGEPSIAPTSKENKDTQIENCSTSIPSSASVCYDPYITLSESFRRESVGYRPMYARNCDLVRGDGTSWYRFNLATGENGVLDHCPKSGTCGTWYPIWMNGTHPTQYGVVKNVMMAASRWGKFSGKEGCFWWSGSALVTKCSINGDVFYLYKLWKTPGCRSSYCTRINDL